MQIEWHQIELKYERLRIVDARFQARLMASLVTDGQQRPVDECRRDAARNRRWYCRRRGACRIRLARRFSSMWKREES